MKIYKFQKNALEIVRIEISEFNGEKYLNVRVWYDAGKGLAQEYKPSHKGLTLSLDKIGELKKGIDMTVDYLEKGKGKIEWKSKSLRKQF